MAKKEENKDYKNIGGLFIPAGIFVGMGFGFLVHNIPAGLFIGMGVGFVAFAITAIALKCTCEKK